MDRPSKVVCAVTIAALLAVLSSCKVDRTPPEIASATPNPQERFVSPGTDIHVSIADPSGVNRNALGLEIRPAGGTWEGVYSGDNNLFSPEYAGSVVWVDGRIELTASVLAPLPYDTEIVVRVTAADDAAPPNLGVFQYSFFTAPAPRIGFRIDSPYGRGGGAGYWWMVQTHTHTVICGHATGTPFQVERAYAIAGWHAIYLSEHIAEPVSPYGYFIPDPDPDGLLDILHMDYSGEVRVYFADNPNVRNIHMNVMGLPEPLPDADIYWCQQTIDRTNALGGLAMINHPDFGVPQYDPTGSSGLRISVEDLLHHQNYSLMEIFNAPQVMVFDTGDSRAKWDALLTAGRRVWGTGTDDCHDPYDTIQFDRYGLLVQTGSEEPLFYEIQDSIREGNFVVVGGTAVGRDHQTLTIAIEEPSIRVDSDQVVDIRWLREGGEEIKVTTQSTFSTYVPQGDENYVRVECYDPDRLILGEPIVRIALTQPFRIEQALSNWTGWDEIAVTGGDPVEAGYVLTLTWDTEARISAGELKTDGSDLVVAWFNGEAWEEIDAEVTDFGTPSTQIRFKARVAAFPGQSGIYRIYYGNDQAVGAHRKRDPVGVYPVYFDDYSLDFTKWTEVLDGDTMVPPDYQGPAWVTQWGLLHQRSWIYGGDLGDPPDPADPRRGTFLYGGDPTWTDYIFQADFATYDGSGMGLMWRRTTDDDYYRVDLDNYEVRTFRDLARFTAEGGYERLAYDGENGYLGDGEWNTLEVEALGSRHKVFLNGELIFDVTDETHPAGNVALYAWKNPNIWERTQDFDRIKLRPIVENEPELTAVPVW